MNISDVSANYQSRSQRQSINGAWVFAGRSCGTPETERNADELQIFCTERSERDAVHAEAAIRYSRRLGGLDFRETARHRYP